MTQARISAAAHNCIRAPPGQRPRLGGGNWHRRLVTSAAALAAGPDSEDAVAGPLKEATSTPARNWRSRGIRVGGGGDADSEVEVEAK